MNVDITVTRQEIVRNHETLQELVKYENLLRELFRRDSSITFKTIGPPIPFTITVRFDSSTHNDIPQTLLRAHLLDAFKDIIQSLKAELPKLEEDK